MNRARKRAPAGRRLRELTIKAFASYMEEEKAQFAMELAMARRMWRTYPHLVECQEFPAYHREVYRSHYGCEPFSADSAASWFKSARKEAMECAREYAQKKLDEDAARKRLHLIWTRRGNISPA